MTATSTAAASHRAIWAVVRRIPRGCVATYGQVAAEAGYHKQPRLAGYALHGAPADIPWHRVINAQGRLSLPVGSDAAQEQRRRLESEGVRFEHNRVDLTRYRWRPRSEAPILD